MDFKRTLSDIFSHTRVPRVTGTRVGLLAAGVLLLISRQAMPPAPSPEPAAKSQLRVPHYEPERLTLTRKSGSVPCGPKDIVSGAMLDCSADNSTTVAVKLDNVTMVFAERVSKTPREVVCRSWEESCRPIQASEAQDFSQWRETFATPPAP